MKVEWTEDQLNFLRSVLDRIIPPNEKKGIPGAGSVALTYLLDRTDEDIEFAKALETLISHIADKPDDLPAELISHAEVAHPEAYKALIRHTYMGYYSKSDIRPHFGLSALPVHPDGYAVAAEDPNELEDLVSPVRSRGPVYREA